MDINIVCVDNGAGLTRDTAILEELIHQQGHRVRVISPKAGGVPPSDINIFLEILNPSMLGCAAVDVLVPNPEWWNLNWSGPASRCEILAKTHDTQRIFQAMSTRGVWYIGFTSGDRLIAGVPRHREFLHVAGRSSTKGTHALMSAWAGAPDLPLLTVVQDPRNRLEVPPAKNIRYLAMYLPDDDVRKLQNRCIFHVCPSRYEGFGHYIEEARSCGAFLLTTNAPPMCEFITGPYGDLISAQQGGPMGLANTWDCRIESIRSTARRAVKQTNQELYQAALQSRWAYVEARQKFHQRFLIWLQGVEQRIKEAR